jgi:hypothetical protein
MHRINLMRKRANKNFQMMSKKKSTKEAKNKRSLNSLLVKKERTQVNTEKLITL